MKLLMQVTVVAALAMVPAGQALANGWVACAGEDQYCSVPGTRMVRYGAGDRWSMKLATRQIRCSNEVFGDPAPGRPKACYYEKESTSYRPDDDRRPRTGRFDGHHGGWVRCAGEGGYCNFNGFREVRYGEGDRWSFKSTRNGIGCSNSVFGDPAPGATKACYYRNTDSSYGPPDGDRRPSPPGPGRDTDRHARWMRCAGEGGFCNFNGVREVRFGSGDRWSYKSSRNGISCSNSIFGDPAPGVVKECFIKAD